MSSLLGSIPALGVCQIVSPPDLGVNHLYDAKLGSATMVSHVFGHTLGYIGATPKIGFSYTSTVFVAELVQVPLFQLIV